VTRKIFLFAILICVAGGAASGSEWRYEAAERIVAIGDVHGDLDAARRALRLAGAIDQNDRWIGGDVVVVQTGDQLDRGDNERAILDLFDRLADEAAEAGGAFHALNGNHEMMNARLDLRYVTPAGWEDFRDLADGVPVDLLLATYPTSHRGRVVAFRPGGPYARLLAERNTIVIVGDNLFVHGGVTAAHVEYGIDRINSEVRAWMLGEGPEPAYIHKGDSPTWERMFSLEVDDKDCIALEEVLSDLGVKRMIVGHTIQEEGINSYCGQRVWCVDVGMPDYYDENDPQVLEITAKGVRVITGQQSEN
jgi:hypothetical protein